MRCRDREGVGSGANVGCAKNGSEIMLLPGISTCFSLRRCALLRRLRDKRGKREISMSRKAISTAYNLILSLGSSSNEELSAFRTSATTSWDKSRTSSAVSISMAVRRVSIPFFVNPVARCFCLYALSYSRRLVGSLHGISLVFFLFSFSDFTTAGACARCAGVLEDCPAHRASNLL